LFILARLVHATGAHSAVTPSAGRCPWCGRRSGWPRHHYGQHDRPLHGPLGSTGTDAKPLCHEQPGELPPPS